MKVTLPVMKSDALDARKTTKGPISSGLAKRPFGMHLMISANRTGSLVKGSVREYETSRGRSR